MDDGVFLATQEMGSRTLGMTPVRARHPFPPGKMVFQRDGFGGRIKADRAGHEHLRRGTGKVFRVRRALGHGDVTGGADKFFKLLVRDLGGVHPETIHAHFVQRSLIRLTVGCAHLEGAGWHPDHAVGPTRVGGGGGAGNFSRHRIGRSQQGGAAARFLIAPHPEKSAERDRYEHSGHGSGKNPPWQVVRILIFNHEWAEP